MNNRFNIYKDEFGNYHEVDEEVETPVDGFEDDEQNLDEDDSDDPFDSIEDEDESFDDEDKDYASERRDQYDIDED